MYIICFVICIQKEWNKIKSIILNSVRVVSKAISIDSDDDLKTLPRHVNFRSFALKDKFQTFVEREVCDDKSIITDKSFLEHRTFDKFELELEREDEALQKKKKRQYDTTNV